MDKNYFNNKYKLSANIDCVDDFDNLNCIQNESFLDDNVVSDFESKSSCSVKYICNGNNKCFDIPFKIFQKEFIKVYIDDVL